MKINARQQRDNLTHAQLMTTEECSILGGYLKDSAIVDAETTSTQALTIFQKHHNLSVPSGLDNQL